MGIFFLIFLNDKAFRIGIFPIHSQKMQDWLCVNGPREPRLWRHDALVEEFEEVISTPQFVNDCLSYMPDLYDQATKDIPRMRVLINGRIRVKTIYDLINWISFDQLAYALVWCTQTIWAHPYEAISSGSAMIVCEAQPPSSAVVNLVCHEARPPYCIRRIKATKRMRGALSVDALLACRAKKIDINMVVDDDAMVINTTCHSSMAG